MHRPSATPTRRRVLRRLLLVPAAALVLIGTPALALDQPSSSNPAPKAEQVQVAAPTQTVGAGYENQVAVNSADLVGVKWKGDPNAQFTVEARDAAGNWATARDIGAADTGADAGSPDARKVAASGQAATDPVAVDGASEIRVTVQRGTVSDVAVEAINSNPVSAPPGSAGALGSVLPRIDGPARYAYAGGLFAIALLLGAIGLGFSPWQIRRRSLRKALFAGIGVVLLAGCVPPKPAPPAPPAPATSLPGVPPIVFRAAWGALPFDPTCGTPDVASQLQYAVVHHTDSPNTDSAADGYARVRSIQLYHMGTLHYCDIAYNFLIDRWGQIYEGRAGGIDQPVIAAHAGGFNTGSVGVALMGTFDNAQPTPAQYDALVSLLRWRLSVGRVNPAIGFITTAGSFDGARVPGGTQVYFSNSIIGHRDVDFTDCPGDAFYTRLAQLRADVQPGIFIPPLPPTTTTTAATTTTTVAPTTTTT